MSQSKKILLPSLLAQGFSARDMLKPAEMMFSPCHQNARDLAGKGLSHLSAAHVGDAVQRQAHEGGVAAGQVVLDGVIDQTDQLAVAVDQH